MACYYFWGSYALLSSATGFEHMNTVFAVLSQG